MMQYMLLALIHEQPGIGVAALARLQNVRGPTVTPRSSRSKKRTGRARRARSARPAPRGCGVRAGLAILETLRARRRDVLAQRIARLTPQQSMHWKRPCSRCLRSVKHEPPRSRHRRKRRSKPSPNAKCAPSTLA